MTVVIRYILSIFILWTLQISYANAQHFHRCQTIHSSDHTHHPGGIRFENWLNSKLIKRKSSVINEAEEEVIYIPVIVHVIHNGEDVGTGSNIPAEQVYSQFDVLNQDYRRFNPDKFLTPPLFKSVAADTRIEFIPADTDPDGQPLPEPGIHRFNGKQTEWNTRSLDQDIKPTTTWGAINYLNIWIAKLEGATLGYSTWPKEPGITGVPTEPGDNNQDGVVINSLVFGSNFTERGEFVLLTDERYNRGRTTTHEIGHYFGLLHPWGVSGGCQDDDFCSDTPATSRNRDDLDFPCSFPSIQNTCITSNDQPDMFQNFMDYTADQCMNLFTNEQALRMKTVIQNSPFRNTLPNSTKIKPQRPPSNLVISELSNFIYEITWDEISPNAISYIIERSLSLTGNFQMLTEVEAGNNTYIDNTGSNRAFFYRIKAINESGESDYSLVQSTPNIIIPQTPVNVSAQIISNDSIQLSWEKADELATRFFIEASENDEDNYETIASISGELETYTFPYSKTDTEYFFKIKAENNGGSSAYSTSINIMTNAYPPSSPSGVNVTFERDSRRYLVSWDDNSDNEDGFIILRSADSLSGYQEIGTVDANTVEFLDASEISFVNTYYLIRAFNNGGNSGFSEVGIFDRVTSLNPSLLTSNILLYPNPTKGRFFITGFVDSPVIGAINIHDASGKSIYTQQINLLAGEFNIPIDVSQFRKGIYFAQIRTSKESFSKKILVE